MTSKRNSTFELLLLLGATLVYLYITPHRIGVNSYDETTYLRMAPLSSFRDLILNQQWGPLYELWYRLLTFLCPDPLLRYFFSWSLLAGLVVLLPACARIRGGWLYGLLMISLPVLIMPAYVAIFASAIFLCGLCWLLSRQRLALSSGFAAACVCAFVAAFARPEFRFSVLLAAAATLLAAVFEWRGSAMKRAVGAKALVALLCGAAMLYVMASSVGADRSALAFLQHFNLRAIERGEIPVEGPVGGWDSPYANHAFGLDKTHGASSNGLRLGDYFRANPRLFLGHLLTNLIDGRTVVLLLAILALLLWPWLRAQGRALRPATGFVGCLCAAPLAGIILVYPHDPYAMTILPILLLLGLQELPLERWPRPTVPAVLAVGAILLICLQVTRRREARPDIELQRRGLARVRCARAVDALVTDPNPVVFETAETHFLSTYVRHPRLSVLLYEQPNWPRFKAWAAATHPAWIQTDAWMAQTFNISAAEMDGFLRNDLGYAPHPCPASPGMVIYTHVLQ